MANGFRVWSPGERMNYDDFQDYIAEQVCPIFATTSARDAQILAPVEGMHCVTTDTDTLWYRTGSGWVAVNSRQKIAYTPALSAAGGSPSVGSTGTRVGYYWYLGGGLIAYKATLTMGGTGISWGTGAIGISVPLANTGEYEGGNALLLDSGVQWYARSVIFSTSTVVNLMAENGTYVATAVPFTPAAGDMVILKGVYEIA